MLEQRERLVLVQHPLLPLGAAVGHGAQHDFGDLEPGITEPVAGEVYPLASKWDSMAGELCCKGLKDAPGVFHFERLLGCHVVESSVVCMKWCILLAWVLELLIYIYSTEEPLRTN